MKSQTHFYRPLITLLQEEFRGYSPTSLRKDFFAGLNVAAVALPLSLAFGLASGATAAAGLVTAILAGFIMGALSGVPNQVSGPTGAMSAVLLVVAKEHGLPGVWVTTLLAGFMILLIGIFRMGRTVLLIPRPVVTGFTSGIAVIIFTGQVHNLLNMPASSSTTALGKWLEFAQRVSAGQMMIDWHTLLTGALVIGLMFLLPGRVTKIVPSSLIAVAVSTLFTLALGFNEPSVGTLPRGLVLDQRLQLGWESLTLAQNVLVPALSVAVLCCLQALLSGAVCSGLTGRKMDADHELIAQGIGNLVIPFLGGVPATGAVARTRVGIASGGVSRFTTIFHALVLLSIVVVAGPILERIPVAALAGVLVVTTVRMNDWGDIRWMFRHRFKSAILGFLATLLATAALDLASAILIGVSVSAILFISRLSEIDVTRTDVDIKMLEERGYRLNSNTQDIGVAYVTGPLFFAATANFRKAFDTNKRYRHLVLSMRGVPTIDVSGLELIEELWERKKQQGGELLLCAVQPGVKKMLDRAGLTQEIGEDKFFWSADQAILAICNAADKGKRSTS